VCEGSLGWGNKFLQVAPAAAQVDIDGFGIDLGLGTPVVTFQVQAAEDDCCRTFQIYSLRTPPKLLRTITGGSFYRTADTDLDGQVEIWTNDAASLIDFENADIDRPEFAPTVILRFVHGRLLDVGSEFQSYFDSQIERFRSVLSPQDIQDFKNSDGRLPPTSHFSLEDLRHSQNLERTKIKVLQIIWAYLYSGREQDAWTALVDMWPAQDSNRIRAAIVAARHRGILSQIDSASASAASRGSKTKIFDLRTEIAPTPGLRWTRQMEENKNPEYVRPIPILIDRQASEAASAWEATGSEVLVDLTIDSAGKVQSAESNNPAFDSSLKGATSRWKFIPAMNGRQSVASRVYFFVSPKR
ncbi:MAG TPA: hypothetical protein VKY31_03090, partial [Terriglobia bacterium]|nr:hypothetical protein [Terriglobia bacterium]